MPIYHPFFWEVRAYWRRHEVAVTQRFIVEGWDDGAEAPERLDCSFELILLAHGEEQPELQENEPPTRRANLARGAERTTKPPGSRQFQMCSIQKGASVFN